MKTEKLNFATKLAYGSGDMGPAMTANVLVFFLLYFLTNVAGLPAGMAGSILAIGDWLHDKTSSETVRY